MLQSTYLRPLLIVSAVVAILFVGLVVAVAHNHGKESDKAAPHAVHAGHGAMDAACPFSAAGHGNPEAESLSRCCGGSSGGDGDHDHAAHVGGGGDDRDHNQDGDGASCH